MFAKELERPCVIHREACLRASGKDVTVSVESGVEDEDWCSCADVVPSEVHPDGGGRRERERERRKECQRWASEAAMKAP